jgi:NAD(P)-dependent dehydrogenase (short-subunit alcohol dehydrogenase family)
LSKQFNGRLFAKTANVTKEESIANAIEEIVDEAGGLHGMVVNAGRTNHKSALDFTEAEIHQLFEINASDLQCLLFQV